MADKHHQTGLLMERCHYEVAQGKKQKTKASMNLIKPLDLFANLQEL